MSHAEWYYVKDDRQNGPVAFENLVELIRSGVLTGESYVWTGGWENWRHAGEVAELATAFAASTSGPAVPTPPAAGPGQTWGVQPQPTGVYGPQPWLAQAAAPPRPTALTVFGVINIVFGSLGLLSLPCSLVATFLPSKTMDPEAIVIVFNVIAHIVGFIVSIILLVSGIGLLKCKDSARRWAFGYGVFSVIWSIVGTIANIANMVLLGSGAYRMEDEAVAFAMGCSCVSLVFLVYPVLLIIFMQKQYIKDACSQ